MPVGNNSRLLVDGSRSQNGGNWRCHLSLLDHDRLLVDVGNAGLSVDLRYTLDEASLNSIRSTIGGSILSSIRNSNAITLLSWIVAHLINQYKFRSPM